MKRLTIGVLGCGDYLSRLRQPLLDSPSVEVVAVYDPRAERARSYAEQLGASIAQSEEDIIEDKAIDVALSLVPPWLRRAQIEKLAKAGKHIVTTKPLAVDINEARSIVTAVEQAGVRCGLLYMRTGNPVIESLKQLIESGKEGRPVLYRHDWLHPYPEWNDWALDPRKNGGPFMDTMIHNLNISRYLIGERVIRSHYFGANLVHRFACKDTESLRVEFENGALADLFISWAPALATSGEKGNKRQRIENRYLITDKGVHLSFAVAGDGVNIVASRKGEERLYPVVSAEVVAGPVFERFAQAIFEQGSLPRDMASLREAYEDIVILRSAQARSPAEFSAGELGAGPFGAGP